VKRRFNIPRLLDDAEQFFRRPAVVNGFEESGLAISGVANGFEVPRDTPSEPTSNRACGSKQLIISHRRIGIGCMSHPTAVAVKACGKRCNLVQWHCNNCH
jgi:hypothetical protein